jgi:hypothetical protein
MAASRPPGHQVGGGAKGIVAEMGVALSGAGREMAEYLADHGKAEMGGGAC